MTASVVAPGDSLPARPLSRAWRRLRVCLVYWFRHGRWPNLERPRRFTEWVQWRKLQPARPALDRLTDKLHSKAVVERRGGHSSIVPTLWSGVELPAQPPGPLPVIVKANHGCRQFLVVRTLADWRRARRRSRRWLRSTYGMWLDEPAYRQARRLLLVEPFLGGDRADLPDDYKVYVFGGRAALVQHHVGRGGAHRWTQYDCGWNRVGGDRRVAERPALLDAMVSEAEALADGHDFLRVDFYQVAGRLWFGEFCLYPGSGLDPFDPPSLDDHLGDLWRSATETGLS